MKDQKKVLMGRSKRPIPDCIQLTSTSLSQEELDKRQELMLEAYYCTKSSTPSKTIIFRRIEYAGAYEPSGIMNPNWKEDLENFRKNMS